MKYLLAKDVGLACGSFVFHAMISTQGQGANLQRTAQVSSLAGAHKAPGTLRTRSHIEEPTQFPAPETVPGIFAWFLKAIS